MRRDPARYVCSQTSVACVSKLRVTALTVHGQTGIQGSLQSIARALNDGGLDDFDTARVQRIVDHVAGVEQSLTVDDGGGLHGPAGTRVGAIRRAPSGEWIIDGQNTDAARADAEIPAADQEQSEPGKDDDEQR
jgi:hypothetical protein